MRSDLNWLSKWQSSLFDKRILELGCGNGLDTRKLVTIGKKLTACDLDISRVKGLKPSPGNFKILNVDHSKPLPFDDESFDIVIASLTLHYFTWSKTVSIVDEISRVLATDGLLVCRLNSSKDVLYGAVGHPRVENGLFNVKGSLKRFFNDADISLLFENWIVSNLEEKTIDRYLLPKVIWEFSVGKK